MRWKKTCCGRSHSSDENNIEFICDYYYLGNEIPNNSSNDSITENNLRNMEDTLRRAEENRNWQYRERERAIRLTNLEKKFAVDVVNMIF